MMKWLVLVMLAGSLADVCRTRLERCERQCATDNTIGSMEHLRCNERCRDGYRYCREEGP